MAQLEKMVKGGRKEVVHGEVGSTLRHSGKEPAHFGISRVDSLSEADGWAKSAKIASSNPPPTAGYLW